MSLKQLFHREKPFFIGVPAFIWQVLFFYVPLLFIVILSFTQIFDVGIESGFTLENYYVFLTPTYAAIIFQSFVLALGTGLLCLLVGYPVAYYIAFYAKNKNIPLFLLIVPFWTNFLLHVFAWFFVLDRTGVINNLLMYTGIISEPIQFLNSMFAIFVVMVYSYLPFMVLPVYSILEKFDKRLVEASQDLGASMTATLFKVIFPLSMPGIISGFFLVFIPSFGEFAIPSLMGGDRYVFVGNVIYNYILGNRTMEVGAAFTVLSVVSLSLFLFLLYRLFKAYIKT
jgi:spermidine/putrescine transport system permease protein